MILLIYFNYYFFIQILTDNGDKEKRSHVYQKRKKKKEVIDPTFFSYTNRKGKKVRGRSNSYKNLFSIWVSKSSTRVLSTRLADQIHGS